MEQSGIKASDIMTRRIACASPRMTLVEASRVMNEFRIGGLPVVENAKLAGIITERDIMRKAVALNKMPSGVLVSEIMSKSPATCKPSDDISVIADIMSKKDITRIPVIDEAGRIVGIVTNRDVLKNSSELMETLLEQISIKKKIDDEYTAYGRCEMCGQTTNLLFKKDRFICDECSMKARK